MYAMCNVIEICGISCQVAKEHKSKTSAELHIECSLFGFELIFILTLHFHIMLRYCLLVAWRGKGLVSARKCTVLCYVYFHAVIAALKCKCDMMSIFLFAYQTI